MIKLHAKNKYFFLLKESNYFHWEEKQELIIEKKNTNRKVICFTIFVFCLSFSHQQVSWAKSDQSILYVHSKYFNFYLSWWFTEWTVIFRANYRIKKKYDIWFEKAWKVNWKDNAIHGKKVYLIVYFVIFIFSLSKFKILPLRYIRIVTGFSDVFE